MATSKNKKTTNLQELEKLLLQQAAKIAQLEKGQAIEAAIERIRVKALTMHHSHEVKDVANVMRKELMGLGLEGISAATIWIEETTGKVRSWDFTNVQEAADSKDLSVDLIIDLEKGRAHPKAYFWNVWNNKKETYSVVESDIATLYASMNWLVELDETMGKEMLHLLDTGQLTYWWHASAAIKKGAITIDFAAAPPPEMAIILPKMAVAFDLAYRRFEDLQKAEVQAREAQVETALERVRSRTMAMHQSEELGEIVATLYKELDSLGLSALGFELILFKPESNILEYWSNPAALEMAQCYKVPRAVHTLFDRQWSAWENQQERLIIELTGKEKLDFDTTLFTKTEFRDLPEEIKKVIGGHVSATFSHVSMKYGLLEAIDFKPLSESEFLIVDRFAKVFEQTYTRFLDLQKAEAQAKEAQIEAALERVRASSMAMHNSTEMQQVVQVMFEQMQPFGISSHATSLEIFDEANVLIDCWFADHLNSYHITHYEIKGKKNPTIRKMWKCWEEQQPNITIHLKGAKKKTYDTYLFTETGFKDVPNALKKDIRSFKEAYFTCCSMQYGLIQVVDHHPIPAENIAIIQRFAKVFEQSYTRFLDLQKAEAQAKEAQIEASMERVRSAAMAMHKSDELAKVNAVVFKELKQLGFDPSICGIGIYDKATKGSIWWQAFEDINKIPRSFSMPYVEGPWFREIYQAWKQQVPYTSFQMVGEVREEHTKLAFAYTEMKDLPAAVKDYLANTDLQLHYISMVHGMLEVATDENLNEAQIQLLQRFTKVIDLTYTRVADLQQAEAQAREAQIEIALERVRARAMAMRHSEELSKAAELLYQEFFKLGVESFSCGYLLNDDEHKVWDIYLTNPGETAFKEFWKCPMEGDAFLKARYQSWKNKEPFHCAVLAGEANRKHHEFIAQFAPWKAEMVHSLPPKLVFNSANFSLGHLLVITTEKMTEELEQAMVRFASVFDLTYRRFLDLEKAEEQNRQLEKVFQENQRLLHSILPEQIAEQIRTGQQTIVKRFEQVSILFADIVGFTILAEQISPQEVVDILNGLFSKFDDLTDKYQLEKIKTIGDAYMVAAGVPEEKENHAQLMFAFAKEMLQTLQDFNHTIGTDLKIRIGISSGPVVAGVIGKKKFAYDLWGDTVNTAARMEANGQADCIQVSPTTYAILKKEAVFKKIPNVEIKGKGVMNVYLWTP